MPDGKGGAMRVKILRGQNQIGGNIIEISTETTRILLDIGLELGNDEQSLPDIDGLFSDAAFDAVFVSHYHRDHLGLAYYIDKQIPLYMGEACRRIVNAGDGYKGLQTVEPVGFCRHNVPIRIGDITITPFLCDHSAFDSYMFLCEANGRRVLYTGDFRANGRKSFSRLLMHLPKKVDTLICEGTTLSRGSKKLPKTEAELEEEAVSLFRKTDGPIFVLQASTNIDRIVTMYRAAKRSGRIFLEELYMAEITAAVGGSIPNPAFRDVYAFVTNSERYEALSKYRRMTKERISKARFVMCVRSTMGRYLRGLSEKMSFEEGVLVYSMWSGYREQPKMREFLEECERLGLKIVSLHTSGHADAATIQRLIDTVHPDEVIPVHTEAPDWFLRETHKDAMV